MNFKSLWMDDYDSSRKSVKLIGNLDTDTVIVGGGLAGILCAYMLKERGIDSVVVEAGLAGLGTTCNTTAKITAQHGLIYSRIEKQHGLNRAREYLSANQEALGEYRRLARDIPCDFEDKTAYVYSVNGREKLDEEAEVYRRMGVEPFIQENPPIPVRAVCALGMEGQAQFHPIKFINAMAGKLCIYEDTFVKEIKPGRVIARDGAINARRIILATHFPMVNLRGLFFMKLYQSRSYVLALKDAQDPGGMYIDEREGGLSFRSQGEYLLLGGGGHRPGEKGEGWQELRRMARAAYPGAKESHAWAAQDCMSLDSIPYIGRHSRSSRELFVITGFNKWGMTGCMAAAVLISQMISEGGGRYEALFSPSRSMLHPQLLVNMGQSASGLISFGKRCPHMGCALRWNPHERTWDCPCHGSRFDRKGNLINNPAKKELQISDNSFSKN
ncbi:MAG: FAD-dependent oxidoreductase [Christensenellales bacterium]